MQAQAGDRGRMLTGLRVVDLTTIVFGPYATQTLADLGAEVIKVEAPDGDIMRKSGASVRTEGMGACHMTLNRGKKSIVLDLKNEVDLEAMRQLIASADLFITNVRQKALARLGLDYEQVKAFHEGIVYVHCLGFGSEGRYRDLPAYDDVIQATTGAATLLGRVDGDARPRYLPSLIADKVAGLHGAYASLAAIVHKLRSGEGQKVEVPLFESFAHFLLQEHLFGGVFDPQPYAMGYPRQLDPSRQPFPTADGYLSIVLYTDKNAADLISLIGDDQLKADVRLQSAEGRRLHARHLHDEMARLLPQRATAHWAPLLESASIPFMPVCDLEQVVNDGHLNDVGFFQSTEHPTEGRYRSIKAPVKFSAHQTHGLNPAPRLGEHNVELASLLARRPML